MHHFRPTAWAAAIASSASCAPAQSTRSTSGAPPGAMRMPALIQANGFRGECVTGRASSYSGDQGTPNGRCPTF